MIHIRDPVGQDPGWWYRHLGSLSWLPLMANSAHGYAQIESLPRFAASDWFLRSPILNSSRRRSSFFALIIPGTGKEMLLQWWLNVSDGWPALNRHRRFVLVMNSQTCYFNVGLMLGQRSRFFFIDKIFNTRVITRHVISIKKHKISIICILFIKS